VAIFLEFQPTPQKMKNAFTLPRSALVGFLSLAALSLVFSAPAQAVAVFNLFYDSGAGPITATINGTLQSDNNTVFVSSVSNPTFDGSATPPLPSVGAATSSSGQAVLSLNGEGLDFFACTNGGCSDGFVFDSYSISYPFFVSGGTFGDTFERINSTYSLTAAIPVPLESDALPVVGSALFMAGGLWWKKKHNQAKAHLDFANTEPKKFV
jgi:hypothetical protein